MKTPDSKLRRALIQLPVQWGTLAGLGAMGLGAAHAQATYPSKPIRMLVGYTPGGFTDNMARTIGEPLAKALGQPVLFDYKPGANSMIAVDMVAKAAPDGYTLTTVIAAHAANPSLYGKMTFNAATDLTPVIVTGVAPLILSANIATPFSTAAELIAYAKANPGKLNYGSSGKGAAAHLAMEQFMANHGISMQHVPYKGTQPALTDLIGGAIQLMFDVPLAMVPHGKAGKIKLIGMASDQRLPGYPDVPTFKEQGTAFIANTWAMVLAPAKTPPEILRKLNSEANRILATPSVREKLQSTGVVPGGGTLDDAARFLNEEFERNAKVVKGANIRLN
ncbi:MAG: tripartite tricarboxylate transporter substrate binding protein [Betaproteobacteria bacterium]|nr:tripartite tricarboxylate transporter substrate binding protein [Betaproteobacteria bacterium]